MALTIDGVILALDHRQTGRYNNKNIDAKGIGKDHQLKSVLENELGGVPTTIEFLNEKTAGGDIDFQYINLPSFNNFKERLKEVL